VIHGDVLLVLWEVQIILRMVNFNFELFMNKKILLYGLFVFVALSFVGCQSASSVQKTAELIIPAQQAKSVPVTTDAVADKLSAKSSLALNEATAVVKDDAVVAVAKEDGVAKLLKMQDQLTEFVKKADVANCSKLELPQFQKSCEVHILVNKAKNKDDVKVCDTASLPEVKQDCLSRVKAL